MVLLLQMQSYTIELVTLKQRNVLPRRQGRLDANAQPAGQWFLLLLAIKSVLVSRGLHGYPQVGYGVETAVVLEQPIQIPNSCEWRKHHELSSPQGYIPPSCSTLFRVSFLLNIIFFGISLHARFGCGMRN